MTEITEDGPQNLGRSERDRLIKSFSNGTKHKFEDISSEMHRTYNYPDGSKEKIEGPLLLNANHITGGHRVFDALGNSHYIQGGWNRISWRVYEGEPHFVK
jgi:hypothetical protein